MTARTFSASLFRALSALLVFVAGLLATADAHAYAWMVRREYTACATCHADPSGGSLLTAYGRGLGEMLLPTRYDGRDGESVDPGKKAEFALGAVKLPEALLLQVDGRYMGLYAMDGGFKKLDSRGIHMQSDVIGQYSFGRLRVNGSLGYLNTPDGSTSSGPTWITGGGASPSDHHLVSRHHWVGFDLGEDKNMLIRVGRMNLPFGLRILEHTSFVRQTTQTDINKYQQTGASFSYNSEKVRTEVMAIAGNFQISPDDYRQRGYAGYFEYAPKTNMAFGASSMVTHAALDAGGAKPVFRHAHGLFARYSPARPVVLMGEVDYTLKSLKAEKAAHGFVGFAQVDWEATAGVHVLGTVEAQNTDVSGDGTVQTGVWAGAQWFFLSHLDARLDLVHRTSQSASTNTLLFQLHGYL